MNTRKAQDKTQNNNTNTANHTNNSTTYKYIRKVKIIDPELGKIDLEILLINSLTINVGKVQEVTDAFLINKEYISIFCFTETRVRSINFTTKGITLHSQERGTREKQGGGLAIGYLTNNNIEMQRKETHHSDIMVLDGKIYNKEIRIILTTWTALRKKVERSTEQIDKYKER